MLSGAASTTGSGQSSGGFRKGSCADALLRFRRIPVQIPGEVSEGSSADSRNLTDTVLRFRRVPLQINGEVLVGSGADTW